MTAARRLGLLLLLGLGAACAGSASDDPHPERDALPEVEADAEAAPETAEAADADEAPHEAESTVEGDVDDGESAVPPLDPAACQLAEPLDWQGVDPAYVRLTTDDWTADKNFYLVTLFLEVPEVGAALAADAPLGVLSTDRLDRLRLAAETCGGEPDCVQAELTWSEDEIAAAGDALARALVDGAPGVDLVAVHLRPSGQFHQHAALDDGDLLRAAWAETVAGLNGLFGSYTRQLDATTLDGLLREVLDGAPALFFEPLYAVAVRSLLAADRDEAGRYEPLHAAGHENAAALAHIPTIDFDAYDFPLILIPGYGPRDLDTPLTSNGKMRCDLAAARYQAGLAPLLATSGGHVHPDRTPYSEAIEMKTYLMTEHGIPEHAILVDPHARHTTTNMRNVARLVIRSGIPADRVMLVTTDWGQNRMIGNDGLDTRCESELGYVPYREAVMLSDNDSCWLASPTALHADARDPLDP